MKKQCLYCYQPLDGETDFHARCSKRMFGTNVPPELALTISPDGNLTNGIYER